MIEHMARVLRGETLAEQHAEDVLRHLASGRADPTDAGEFLLAVARRGETVDEIRGFARGMRALAVRPPIDLARFPRAVDVVGTGGDGSGSLNLSTGSALLAAAAGLPVVKHGNGSITSRSGSADVLDRLGLPTPLEPRIAARCLDECGFTFLFAPRYHPAMKEVAAVRRALGVRTIFNLLGPLTNPAGPPYHVIGAWSEDVAERMAECLSGLGATRSFVVHGEPGWDEATPCGPFTLFDVRPGSVRRERRDPADLGLARCTPGSLLGGTADDNARAIRRVFDGEESPHRDALTLGAALALEVTGTSADAAGALATARAAIDDGRARAMLARIGSFGAGLGTTPVGDRLSRWTANG
ncbi:MAG: anthranilate phosphoribosyltransferase [Gemmatimonadota bacterium]